MSFAATLLYRVGLVAAIVAVVVGVMAAVAVPIVSAFNAVDISLDGNVSAAIQTGREIANNFINAKVLNLCLAGWLGAYPVCLGIYLFTTVQKWFDI